MVLLPLIGADGIILYFVKRYFNRRDAREQRDREKREAREKKEQEKRDALFQRVDAALETLRLLAYHRMSQEIERLLDQGYATPAERRVLDEMYDNYKAHGWNGDMEARLDKVYSLRTDHAPIG